MARWAGWYISTSPTSMRCAGGYWRSSTASIWIGQFPCWSKRCTRDAVVKEDRSQKDMKLAHISTPGGDWDMVERPIPEPAAGHVRIKVQACGICHSEALVKEGHWPGLHSPRVPGHEVVGIVDAVGAGVSPWKPGQCVGIGWHGGHCGSCDACRNGDCFTCYVALKTTGIAFDGGDAAYMVAPAMALALVPDALSAVEAAPLMCAGLTTYNALRNSGARAGDLVAIH